jgi:chemotaxis protein MotB
MRRILFALLGAVLQGGCASSKLAQRDQRIDSLQSALTTTRSDLTTCRGNLEECRAQLHDLGAMVDAIDGAIPNPQVFIVRAEGEVRIILPNRLLFDSGSANLNAGGKNVIQMVANALKPYASHNIIVEGHTDTEPITGSLKKLYKDNWMLSFARAHTVAMLVISDGIPPEAIVMAGRGPYDPIASNADEATKDDNRRVEIHVSDRPRANSKAGYTPPDYKTRRVRAPRKQ